MKHDLKAIILGQPLESHSFIEHKEGFSKISSAQYQVISIVKARGMHQYSHLVMDGFQTTLPQSLCFPTDMKQSALLIGTSISQCQHTDSCTELLLTSGWRPFAVRKGLKIIRRRNYQVQNMLSFFLLWPQPDCILRMQRVCYMMERLKIRRKGTNRLD